MNVNRQYIGARYVPLFFENPRGGNDWLSGYQYDALTIVTYLNQSYTSKKAVPASVGNPKDNPEYWVMTANYNAQVERYRQEVVQAKKDVDASEEKYKTDMQNQYNNFTSNTNAHVTDFEEKVNKTLSNFVESDSNPTIVGSEGEMTDHNRVYVLRTNMHIYYWNGNDFVDSTFVYGSGAGVSQTTGASASDVMSQKIVTDLLFLHRGRITSGDLFDLTTKSGVYLVYPEDIGNVKNIPSFINPRAGLLIVVLRDNNEPLYTSYIAFTGGDGSDNTIAVGSVISGKKIHWKYLANTAQTTGNSKTDVMSQEAVTNDLFVYRKRIINGSIFEHAKKTGVYNIYPEDIEKISDVPKFSDYGGGLLIHAWISSDIESYSFYIAYPATSDKVPYAFGSNIAGKIVWHYLNIVDTFGDSVVNVMSQKAISDISFLYRGRIISGEISKQAVLPGVYNIYPEDIKNITDAPIFEKYGGGLLILNFNTPQIKYYGAIFAYPVVYGNSDEWAIGKTGVENTLWWNYPARLSHKMKISVLGDSISANIADRKNWTSWITEYLVAEVQNLASDGAPISDNRYAALSAQIDSVENADVIVIFGGTNDYGVSDYNATIGSEESVDKKTVYGGLNYIAKECLEKHPTASVLFVTPLYRKGCTMANDNGFTLNEVAECVRKVAKKNNFMLLDLYNTGNFYVDNPTKCMAVTMNNDGLHPNTDWSHYHLAPMICNTIKAIG